MQHSHFFKINKTSDGPDTIITCVYSFPGQSLYYSTHAHTQVHMNHFIKYLALLLMMMDDFGFFIIATDLCLSHFWCVARTYVDLSAGTCDFVTLSGPKWSGCGYVT